MSKFINGLVGFITGATAGIVTGLLVAPRKGKETRQLIKDKTKKVSKNFKTEIEDKVDETREAISDFAKPNHQNNSKKK